ncbi:TPA: hypothetical protein JD344_16970 [Serratia marcescens]|nr:hypothetical protein [Serratia marcescens]HAU5742200.1 hypothetical protein [Serratia marcescens]HAU5746200.1 hypothetical protein [Serratia marcescens]HAU5758469.1 hypothetical protein [Serratia marcescens]
MQSALQGSDVLTDDVHRRAGIGTDEDSHGLISAVFVALDAHCSFLYVALLAAVFAALGGGLHNMSSQ